MKYGFDNFYDSPELSFGSKPSPELKKIIGLLNSGGKALDIGAGDGRNSLYLARNGFRVTAIDNSIIAMKKLNRFASHNGLKGKVLTICSDVRVVDYPHSEYDLAIAVTIFDHLPKEDIYPLFEKISNSLIPDGYLFVRVHTIDDPGFRHDPVNSSELSKMIKHYFRHDELKTLLDKEFRLNSYEETTSADNTHGPRHYHGFASAIGQKIR